MPLELKDAMDLAYLTGQRPASVLKVAATGLDTGFLMVKQGENSNKLRLRPVDESVQSGISTFIDDLQRDVRSALKHRGLSPTLTACG